MRFSEFPVFKTRHSLGVTSLSTCFHVVFFVIVPPGCIEQSKGGLDFGSTVSSSFGQLLNLPTITHSGSFARDVPVTNERQKTTIKTQALSLLLGR